MIRTIPVESDSIWAIVEHSPLGYPRSADRRITTRINLVNLGNAQILTVPGEALPTITSVRAPHERRSPAAGSSTPSIRRRATRSTS